MKFTWRELVAGVVVIGFMLSLLFGPSDPEMTGNQAKERQLVLAKCQDNLQCWGEYAILTARLYCTGPIERLVGGEYRWTDIGGRQKFDTFSWLSKERGILRLKGAALEVRHGDGKYIEQRYHCDYDPQMKKVLDTGVVPSRSQGIAG